MKEIKEIERRFLLKQLPIVNWTKIYEIVQYYINDTETGVTKRLRVTYDAVTDTIDSYEYLHKINVGVGEFVEVHEELNSGDYKKLKSQAFKHIAKRRYVYVYNTLKFEVDVIDGICLVLMEVELNDINQTIDFPQEIKSQIITEITGLKDFSNFELATPLPKYVEQ